MEKRLLQFLGLILFLVALNKLWHPFWKFDLNEATDPGSTEKIIFSIEKGSGASTIADELEDADLIGNKRSFIRTVEQEELDGSLRYGSFVLSPGMTLREIVTILTTEGTGELALTVIEGWTIQDIDARLTELGLIESSQFRTCAFNCDFSSYTFLGNDVSLEGFLFPDTYFLDGATFTSETLIRQMLNNFDTKWTDEMDTTLESSGRTLHEVVNVAAMVEKEVRTPDDLPVVAGIIWKRLDKDWALGIDATLLYNDEDGVITADELSEEDPYNTRINTGLPPTAIGNPGLTALEAALEPQSSEYWFYLTDSKGSVHYAITNEKHEENKAKYLN